MTTNDRKSYFGYLNKLVDEYDNTYHHCLGKKLIHADYSGFPEEFESSHKFPKFKVGKRVKITLYKNILARVTPLIGPE